MKSRNSFNVSNLNKYDLDAYISPFWKTKKIYHETLTFVGEEDVAPLLFYPTEIICVRNFSLDVVYQNGTDYILTDSGKIKRQKGSSMPYFRKDEFYLKEPGIHSIRVVEEREGVRFETPRYFAFGEKDFMISRQVAVSYYHEDEYFGVIPTCKRDKLKNTIRKLVNKQNLKIVFYGDSITVGANASGFVNVPPFMDRFDEMVVKYLEKQFGTTIDAFNCAVGGWSVKDGKEKFSERISSFIPDLMVLGFGMNGATAETKAYKADICDIIRQARELNPECEVVLLATSLPNPASEWIYNQPFYADVLHVIEQEFNGVAVADMTAVHKDLLNRKRYRDMTGNNINHPNDFLIRVYAQVLLQTIVGI